MAPTDLRRRKHKRYGQSGTVTLCRVITGASQTGDLFELSVGGCLIWLDLPVRYAPSDILEVRLQTSALSLRVLGQVRYASEGGRLVGLEFKRIGAQDFSDLGFFINELEAAAAREHSLAF